MKSKFLYAVASIVLSGLIIFNFSCKNNSSSDKQYANEINRADFDNSVKPGDNFFDYVDGNWVKNNPIPSTEAAWGSFNILADSITLRLHAILVAAAASNNADGSTEQKVGDFYATAMDSVSINKQGIEPLKDELARINAISNNKSLWSEAARLMKMGASVMFTFYVAQDDKISSDEICKLMQGGMLLPDKVFYTDTIARMKMIRDRYVTYCTKLFERMGESHETAVKDAQKVLDMETQMAAGAMTSAEQRNVHALYNKMPLADVEKMSPNIEWTTCLDTFGLKSVDSVIVTQPKFIQNLNDLTKSFSLDDWKKYLSVHFISELANRLDDDLANAKFDFYDKTLRGIKEMKPRWKRSVEATNMGMGELLGQLYIAKYFSPETKEKVHQMVENLISAYKERISALTWMNPETKKFALEKLDKITLKLCYPDKWKDFSALKVKKDAYVLNAIRVAEYHFNYNMNKLGKPVDRTEWSMSPQTVNAYYEPTLNEIVFPAAIMQPPFFDPNRDDAMNYGALGAVIGHELTHGFDDQGNQYDAEGNMRKWWTNEDSIHYFSKLAIVIRQFNNYEMDSVHVNGKLTLGENTADLGGLTIAYMAMENVLKDHPEGDIDGFTPEQRFFIAFATVWRQNARPAFIQQLVKTNPHSPPYFRVLGPLSNMNEFYKAFDVKPGDKMYRADSLRAVIW